MRKSLRLVIFLVMVMSFSSCVDNAVVDTNVEIPNRNWTYVNKLRFPVKIADPDKEYTLFFNLRHTGDYKYANIFILLHLSGPGIPRTNERKEFPLAYPDGEWLGSGSGDLFSYQLPLKAGVRFPKKGTYTIELEHNMRDNPLREISDVGIRIEPEH